MPFRQADKFAPVALSREREHDVGRAVLGLKIGTHPVHLHPLNRLDRTQDVLTERMTAEMRGLGGIVGDRHRIILIHLDFFDDHLLLGVEVFLAKRGAEDVGEDVERLRQILGKAGDVVEGVFLGGLRVVLGADACRSRD